MVPFSTEFPIQSFENPASFVAEVIAWLRGTKYSNVLSVGADAELDKEYAHLQSFSGEQLRLRQLRPSDTWEAIGFRHDFPDLDGRLWRTEGVLRRAGADNHQDLIRLRTHCTAARPGVQLESPRKPYLVKSLLKNGWGGFDRILKVSDKPVWLENNEKGLTTARAVTQGTATNWLPTVYFSAIGSGEWLLSPSDIDKLAYDLGGVAHIVVEPDRSFSFRLRDETKGKNAYGGTVGLALPEEGIVRRYYLGWQIQNSTELASALRTTSLNLHGQMPSSGWDWTDLQEQVFRAQREREKNKLNTQESEQLYQEEIANLLDKNRQLEELLRNRTISRDVGTDESEFTSDNLVHLIGPEVYVGEVSDRLRFAAKTTLSVADQFGIDRRSKVLLERVVDRLPLSPALNELLQDLGRATKDPKRLASELTSLLLRHGYREKSDNKHIRLEAKNGFDGLDAITLPKTPSDSRSLKNICKQIERTLGITKMSE